MNPTIIHDPFFAYLVGCITGATVMALFELVENVLGTRRLMTYMKEQDAKKKEAVE
jgi:hypothetical protein